jgi:Protein of unknown function (DUF995)
VKQAIMSIVAMVTAGLAAGGAISAEATPGAPENDAKPMGVEQLYKVYRNKTWVWQDGGGFFASDGRFAAWSGEGDAASYAEGRWWASGTTGDVCFQATWHSAKGAERNRTCFAHRAIGGVIYQKKEPSGAWYQFKNLPSCPNDEFQKLREGDQVTENLKQLKALAVKE